MTRAQRRAAEASRLREGRRRARAARWRSPCVGLWVAERNGLVLEVDFGRCWSGTTWRGMTWCGWVGDEAQHFPTMTRAQWYADDVAARAAEVSP